MLQHITRHLFYEKLNNTIYKTGTCKPHKLKERDFRYHQLGGLLAPYKPKGAEGGVETLTTKDQGGYSTCSWNAYTVMREITEKKPLSVASIVAYAKSVGLLSGEGFSTLANNHKAGCDFGIAEESLINNDLKGGNWNEYSAASRLTKEVRDNAYTHRADYRKVFYVKTIDEYLKALDDGYAIEIGINWYSKYNMNGGFSAPWVIKWKDGIYVGDHAIDVKRFKNLIYNGDRVVDGIFRIQNSYSKAWGDGGDFYVKISDLINAKVVGMVEVDLTEENIVEFIKSLEGKFVKHAYSPAIWKIEDGQKRSFLSDFDYAAFGGKTGVNRNWTLVAQSMLDKIPEGAPMDIKDSPIWNVIEPNWDILSKLQNPANMKKLAEVIKANQSTVDYYNKQNGNVSQSLWSFLLSLFIK